MIVEYWQHGHTDHHLMQTGVSLGHISLLCIYMSYLGEAQVEVSLQGAPLSGDDLVEDGGQQEGEDHPEKHEEQSGDTLLDVEAVMLTLGFRKLLPQQQASLRTTQFHSQ